MTDSQPTPPPGRARSGSRRAGLPQKLALIAGSLIATALGIELLLQIGGLFIGRDARSSASRLRGSNIRILTLGDSNTFGLYLEEEDSYPYQLESLWNASVASPKVDVANLAYPGTNSVGLFSNYGRLLDSLAPQVVLVQIGANDFWTPPVELNTRSEAGLHDLVARYSRLYKLLYMLRRAYSEPPEVEVDYDRSLLRFGVTEPGGKAKPYWTGTGIAARSGVIRFGDETFQIQNPGHNISTVSENATDMSTAAATLAENLGYMFDVAREQGIEIAFLTYPSDRFYYGKANTIIRRVARQRGAPLIAIRGEFERLCPDEECAEHLFPDHHANAKGYSVVAKAILGWLQGKLGES